MKSRYKIIAFAEDSVEAEFLFDDKEFEIVKGILDTLNYNSESRPFSPTFYMEDENNEDVLK